MKIVVKLSLFVVLLSLAACKESFVNVDNPGAISTASYPGTIADLEQLLAGVYATQHAPSLFGHNMLAKNTYLWDHTTDLSWQGTTTWIQLAQNNSQVNDSFLQGTWQDLWRGYSGVIPCWRVLKPSVPKPMLRMPHRQT
ncbi:hypothetical protein [Spirosoma telluris]|uniref:hypothetical protein n=1 Tax=Spirosoma telluris TaxID=2183553 RepID=UPI002FC2E1C7